MKTPSDNPSKDAQIAALSDEVAQLKHQLDWLKRQLFGRKSEKVLVDNCMFRPIPITHFGSIRSVISV